MTSAIDIPNLIKDSKYRKNRQYTRIALHIELSAQKLLNIIKNPLSLLEINLSNQSINMSIILIIMPTIIAF